MYYDKIVAHMQCHFCSSSECIFMSDVHLVSLQTGIFQRNVFLKMHLQWKFCSIYGMTIGTIKHTIKLHCLEKMTNLPGFLSRWIRTDLKKLMQFVYFDGKTNDWHLQFPALKYNNPFVGPFALHCTLQTLTWSCCRVNLNINHIRQWAILLIWISDCEKLCASAFNEIQK